MSFIFVFSLFFWHKIHLDSFNSYTTFRFTFVFTLPFILGTFFLFNLINFNERKKWSHTTGNSLHVYVCVKLSTSESFCHKGAQEQPFFPPPVISPPSASLPVKDCIHHLIAMADYLSLKNVAENVTGQTRTGGPSDCCPRVLHRMGHYSPLIVIYPRQSFKLPRRRERTRLSCSLIAIKELKRVVRGQTRPVGRNWPLAWVPLAWAPVVGIQFWPPMLQFPPGNTLHFPIGEKNILELSLSNKKI